jgi:hypothetical protein
MIPSRSRLWTSCLAGAIVACVLPAAALPAQEASEGGEGERLTCEKLDALVDAQRGQSDRNHPADARFLRRATFDLVGRPPSAAEQEQFAADTSPDKNVRLIERLLASPELGANWASYWADVIGYRVPPPELTYLNYDPLKSWLAGKLNANTPWDEVVRKLLTGKGKVQDNPTATFVGYHQAKATNLASETARIFLGQNIACAECHDHPFAHWKRVQYHQMAAFFARSKAKLPWNDSGAIVVSAAEKGEYQMSDASDPTADGTEIKPAFLDGRAIKGGRSDKERRAALARFVTATDNPWFAQTYTNRVWGRLMGRGFYEPLDDLDDTQPPLWPEVHAALARHFVATGFDVKDLFRLVAGTRAYAQAVRMTDARGDSDTTPEESPRRLRSDEVFAALHLGLELPNVTPPAVQPTDAVRFPPPPKSTQELLKLALGVDPSLRSSDAPRTIAQALWMMNNEQLQREINAAPLSGTMLSKLLDSEADDSRVCQRLFMRVLARAASDDEVRIAREQVTGLGDRRAAFEDLLWALVNSAEFTARR